MSQVIKVYNITGNNAILELCEDNLNLFKTKAYIGKNGITNDKQEGDGKTPIGTFDVGIAFGTHNKNEINYNNYIEINKDLYWVDDVESKYYNQLIDIGKIQKDWKSAEHLIEYSKQYEYAIEIKTNPNNIRGKGSAIFLHCSTESPTAGCITIDKEQMKKLLDILEAKVTIQIIKNT